MALDRYIGEEQFVNEQNIVRGEYPLIYCITFRTQEDVDRVKYLTEALLNGTNTEMELAEFQSDMIGALNYSDLDRIERNITILSELLHVPILSMDRDIIPRVSYFDRLLINVKRIRASNYRMYRTPEVPEKPINYYTKVNDIERILWDAYIMWVRNHSNNRWEYCGQGMYAGSEMLI